MYLGDGVILIMSKRRGRVGAVDMVVVDAGDRGGGGGGHMPDLGNRQPSGLRGACCARGSHEFPWFLIAFQIFPDG